MLFRPNAKLVMIGDSITDCGRNHPFGEGGGLGDGYVRMVDAILGASMPQLNLRILNVGSSGNTVRDLADRWDRDVLALKPDYLSIMIGTNDVWRQFDQPLRPDLGVPIGPYETILTELTQRAQSAGATTILVTPFFIESNCADPMRAAMDRYGQVVRKIAVASGSTFVDTQAAFDRVLEHRYSAALSWDRVHPNHIGHMILARAFLQAIGFSG